MAFGSGTINAFAGAASDLFAADADRFKATGLRIKAQGDAFEGKNYDLAASLADQNAQYTEYTTNIKQQQQDRTTFQALGNIQSEVAGSGLKMSGSALDVLHESAANGAITKEVLGVQGQITEAGYLEQGDSYRNLSKAAAFAVEGDNLAADAADHAAVGAETTAGLKSAAGVFSLVTDVAGLFTGGGLLGGLLGGAGGVADTMEVGGKSYPAFR